MGSGNDAQKIYREIGKGGVDNYCGRLASDKKGLAAEICAGCST